MKPFRISSLAIAFAALALTFAACGGDDESSDADALATEIEISIPTGTETTGTSTSATDQKKSQENAGKEIGKALNPEGQGKGFPNLTEEQAERIQACVEKAQGDPEKLAACGAIVND